MARGAGVKKVVSRKRMVGKVKGYRFPKRLQLPKPGEASVNWIALQQVMCLHCITWYMYMSLQHGYVLEALLHLL